MVSPNEQSISYESVATCMQLAPIDQFTKIGCNLCAVVQVAQMANILVRQQVER
jgi:hypothetical protein